MSEKSYFAGKIQDLIRREQRGESMVFSSFLTSEEGEEAAAICNRFHSSYFLNGGYDDAERKILAISSYDEETMRFCFPIVAISVSGYNLANITNRDVLGALMSAGIRRECLGDIIARDGTVLFFAEEQIADFLIENVVSIGREKVILKRIEGIPLIPPPQFEEHRDTVASLRLDAVVSSLLHVSREQACKMIDLGYVSIDHNVILKKTREVWAGARIVVRHRGKWIVDECGSQTKKGRIVINTRKYI